MAKSTSKLFQSEEPKQMKEDAMNLPEEEVKEKEADIVPAEEEKTEIANMSTNAQDAPVNDIVDVDISAIRKKRFRINGDNNKIIELNVSDLNIMSRLTTAYDRLQKYMEDIGEALSNMPDLEDDENAEERNKAIENTLDEIDAKMRSEVDYIFDSPISDKCADGGSMYDPFEGAFRYEHIIEAILKLYERNLDTEFAKMRRRVSERTARYTKKYHK